MLATYAKIKHPSSWFPARAANCGPRAVRFSFILMHFGPAEVNFWRNLSLRKFSKFWHFLSFLPSHSTLAVDRQPGLPGKLLEHLSTDKAFEIISEHVRPCKSRIILIQKSNKQTLITKQTFAWNRTKNVKPHANLIKKQSLYKRYMRQRSTTMTWHHLRQNRSLQTQSLNKQTLLHCYWKRNKKSNT